MFPVLLPSVFFLFFFNFVSEVESWEHVNLQIILKPKTDQSVWFYTIDYESCCVAAKITLMLRVGKGDGSVGGSVKVERLSVKFRRDLKWITARGDVRRKLLFRAVSLFSDFCGGSLVTVTNISTLRIRYDLHLTRYRPNSTLFVTAVGLTYNAN